MITIISCTEQKNNSYKDGEEHNYQILSYALIDTLTEKRMEPGTSRVPDPAGFIKRAALRWNRKYQESPTARQKLL